ncbi:helix-turn-helix transcriptional regulator [Eggerthella sinensis]|uniref:helix-turn-helix transcriptional regulator n=1 Tax=Eggerthella sinensis TaxID=242230 RepID=UPI001D08275A|nr:helix-turn-helix transcriptional regulator [Eggerthella sinensis]MCB7038307.1 helix-turn-helix transcriptional regulator [Eggerthella sinensis]
MKHAGWTSYLSMGLAVAALACCFSSIYFIQYSVIGGNVSSTLVVTASAVVTMFGAAAIAYVRPLKLLYFLILFAALLLARYVVLPDAIGSELPAMNIIMGCVLGLCPIMAGCAATYRSTTMSFRVILLGFAGAALLMGLLRVFSHMSYMHIQEVCLMAFAAAVALFLLLHRAEPVKRESVQRTLGHERAASWVVELFDLQGPTLFVLGGSALLLFCYGVFETYALANGQVMRDSGETMLAIFVISVVLLIVGRSRYSSKRFEALFTVLYVVYVAITFGALLMGVFPGPLFLVMGVGAIVLHMLIWLHLAQATVTKSVSPVFTFGVVLGAVMVSHRLGWLVTMVLTALFPDDGALVSKLAAGVLAVIALAAAFVLFVVLRRVTASSDGRSSVDAAAARSQALARYFERAGLTQREREIAVLYCQGRSTPYISDELFISETTVKTHIRHLYAKLDVHNKQDLLSAADKAIAAETERDA